MTKEYLNYNIKKNKLYYKYRKKLKKIKEFIFVNFSR